MEVSALSLAGNYKGNDWEVIGKAAMHQWSLCKCNYTKHIFIFCENYVDKILLKSKLSNSDT